MLCRHQPAGPLLLSGMSGKSANSLAVDDPAVTNQSSLTSEPPSQGGVVPTIPAIAGRQEHYYQMMLDVHVLGWNQ